MELKKMNINDLQPANYNPRVDLEEHDEEYQKIKRSIKEFGYVDPIIWNKKTNNIVGGHQRFKVLKDLGYQEVDVSVVDLDEQAEKTLNIALNKVEGDWDADKLKEVIEELDASMRELTGFDDDEIENLMNDMDVDSLFQDDDEATNSNNDDGESKLERAIELLKLTHDKLIDDFDDYKSGELYKAVEYFLEDV
ncbi:ParB N-terminal domain-containing protein [Staphylococcus pseudintermedius]|nr:ParB N-terminal domain-containing protein [Staphylococcus pseudintermedius]MDF0236869.1 ParB N-terminal domain-containing protein [Staphylococcus pseudintermedius]